MRQILVNLLSNAVKFMRQGEVFVQAEAEAVDADTQRIRFCVKDTGIGIAAVWLARGSAAAARCAASLAQLSWRGWWLRSHNPQLRLDFGGYAKGVALDWPLDRLQRGGAPDALPNLGGNLAVRDLAGRARPWRVGIRDPLGPLDPLGSRLAAQLAVVGPEAVVTSGTYKR